jgi:hypothetical protein
MSNPSANSALLNAALRGDLGALRALRKARTLISNNLYMLLNRFF